MPLSLYNIYIYSQEKIYIARKIYKSIYKYRNMRTYKYVSIYIRKQTNKKHKYIRMHALTKVDINLSTVCPNYLCTYSSIQNILANTHTHTQSNDAHKAQRKDTHTHTYSHTHTPLSNTYINISDRMKTIDGGNKQVVRDWVERFCNLCLALSIDQKQE